MSNRQPESHIRLTLGTVDDKLGRRNGAASECHGSEQRALGRTRVPVHVHLAGTGALDGVPGWEVGFELAAVGTGGDGGEVDVAVSDVGLAGVLLDVEVYGEADAGGVGDAAGAAFEW